MEELLFLEDIQSRYRVGVKRAREIMRQMPHHERPMFVTVSACAAWERNEMICPGSKTGKAYRAAKKPARPTGKFLVPRERPEAI